MAALLPRAQGSGRVITQTVNFLTTTYTALVTFGNSRTATLAAITAAPTAVAAADPTSTIPAAGTSTAAAAAAAAAPASAPAYPDTNLSSPQIALVAILGILGGLALVSFFVCVCRIRDLYVYQARWRRDRNGGGGSSTSGNTDQSLVAPSPEQAWVAWGGPQYPDGVFRGTGWESRPHLNWEKLPPHQWPDWVQVAPDIGLETAPLRVPPERATYWNWNQAGDPQLFGNHGYSYYQNGGGG